MLKFISLSSGSSGNCYFLSDTKGRGILIDAGVSLRRLKKVLSDNGFSLDSFQAILITHDHLDHIRHLGSYCKHLRRPVFTTGAILDALKKHSFTTDHISPYGSTLPEGEPFRIPLDPSLPCDELPLVSYFIVPHDATQTVGYYIVWKEVRLVLMTDIGSMTEESLEYARKANVVVIESNYDIGSLLSGPYPHELKMRICGGSGHLGNEECAKAVKDFWHKGLRNIFLCHLSDNNNSPSLAYETVSGALKEIPSGEGTSTAKDVTFLETLPRGRASRVFDLDICE